MTSSTLSRSRRVSPVNMLWVGLMFLGSTGSTINQCWAEGASSKSAAVSTKLTPEQEAGLQEFVKKHAAAKRKLWQTRLTGEVVKVKRIVDLEDNGVQRLTSAIESVLDACAAAYEDKIKACYLEAMAGVAGNKPDELAERNRVLSRAVTLLEYVGPTEHPTWLAVLKAALSAKQMEALTLVQTEEKRVIAADLDSYAKRWLKTATAGVDSRALQEQVSEIRRMFELSPDRAKQLDAIADRAMDQFVENCRDGASKILMSHVRDNGWRAGRYPRELYSGGSFTKPEMQSTWNESKAKFLSAAELERWKVAEKKKREEEDKQLETLLRKPLELFQTRVTEQILSKVAEQSAALKLSKERAGQLETLAKEAAEDACEAWLSRAKSHLRQWNPGQRMQMEMVNAAGDIVMSMPQSAADAAGRQAVWKDGITQILTAAELEILSAGEQAERKKRAAILGQILIMHLDSICGFNSVQRKKLQPIAERLSLDQSQFFSEEAVDNTARYSIGAFFSESLAKFLSAAELERWKVAEKKKREEEDKQLETLLRKPLELFQTRVTEQILSKVAEQSAALKLSKERAGQLETLAKEAAEDACEAWLSRAKSHLRQWNPGQRMQMEMVNAACDIAITMGQSAADAAGRQAVWKDGITQILTAAELEILSAGEQAERKKRAAILGQILIMHLDSICGFNSVQRKKLQPIAERLSLDQSQFFSEEAVDNTERYSIGAFFSVAAKATQEELRSVLDPVQYERWQQSVRSTSGVPVSTDRDKSTQSNPGTDLNEFDLDQAELEISEYLDGQAGLYRQRVIARHMLKAEDMIRNTAVSEQSAARLKTAALGASEIELEAWKVNTERTVRGTLRGQKISDITEELARIQDYHLGRSYGRSEESKVNGERVMEAELSQVERAAWDRVKAERLAYQQSAIVCLVALELERQTRVDLWRTLKLEPLIVKIITDYQTEISRFFESNSHWYTSREALLVPIGGVPKEELEKVLSAGELNYLLASPGYKKIKSLFTHIQRTHDQRLKEKK